MRIKQLARTTARTPFDIVTEVLNGMPADAVGTMASIDLLKKQVQYARNREGIQLYRNPPRDRATGWEVPQELQTFLEDGNAFLQWDSGVDDPNRILIFASNASIMRLHTVEHFYSDGCMRDIPLFYQLYSLHGKLVSTLFYITVFENHQKCLKILVKLLYCLSLFKYLNFCSKNM